MNARTRAFVALSFAVVLCAPAAAQWIGYKTPGIPRLPDGRPQAGFVRNLAGGPRGAVRLRLRRHSESEARRHPAVGARSAVQARAGFPEGQPARALHAGERPVPE